MNSFENKVVSRAGRHPGILVLIPLMLLTLLLYGCGNDPMSPTVGADDSAAMSAPQAGPSWHDRTRCSDASGWITAGEGGEIDLGFKGRGGIFSVAPGAVDEDVFVDISICRNNHPHGGDYDFIQLEFGPTETTFAPPATLELKVGALHRVRGHGKLRVLKLYYFNEDTGDWEVAAQSRIRRGKVKFKIEHFSKYGISS